jgi:hypothetical protein
MRAWCIAIFAVAGGLVLGGLGGVLCAGLLGFWDTPVGGFCAAFARVGAAYIAAPSHRLSFAAFALAVGAALAWLLLKDSFYPENYPQPYRPTWAPLLATYAGGVLAFVSACLWDIQSRRPARPVANVRSESA